MSGLVCKSHDFCRRFTLRCPDFFVLRFSRLSANPSAFAKYQGITIAERDDWNSSSDRG
jgi:hypothetical protein